MATQTNHKPAELGRCLIDQSDFAQAYARMTGGGIPPKHHNRLAAMAARCAINEVDELIEWMTRK